MVVPSIGDRIGNRFDELGMVFSKVSTGGGAGHGYDEIVFKVDSQGAGGC